MNKLNDSWFLSVQSPYFRYTDSITPVYNLLIPPIIMFSEWYQSLFIFWSQRISSSFLPYYSPNMPQIAHHFKNRPTLPQQLQFIRMHLLQEAFSNPSQIHSYFLLCSHHTQLFIVDHTGTIFKHVFEKLLCARHWEWTMFHALFLH